MNQIHQIMMMQLFIIIFKVIRNQNRWTFIAVRFYFDSSFCESYHLIFVRIVLSQDFLS